MKKIGVLMDETMCPAYFYDILNYLSEHADVELYLFCNEMAHADAVQSKKIRILDRLTSAVAHPVALTRKLAFWSLVKFESRICHKLRPNECKHAVLKDAINLSENKITMHPEFSASGLWVDYAEEDIKQIKQLSLDLILRGNAPGIFRGDILTAAKDGVLSFHHGDNRWNRGGPPGFWEVYLREPSSGFIIQVLSEKLDGGQVLFRGNVPTKQFYYQNMMNISRVSAPFMQRLLMKYIAEGEMPLAEASVPYSHPLYKAPKTLQVCCYLYDIWFKFIIQKSLRRLSSKRLRWSVSYLKGNWQDAVLRKATKIKNPPGHFYADPFVVTRNEQTICFVEDYDYSTGRGCVSAVELIDNRNYRLLGPVIQEPFHMSFPYLFEVDGDLYMIPETLEAKQIRLYKCTSFPNEWSFVKALMEEVLAADTVVFSKDDKWWLMTNVEITDSLDTYSVLEAYSNKDFLADEWRPHMHNPLLVDSRVARNGGMLKDFQGNWIRVRQKQGFNFYGRAFTLARIDQLTHESYRESMLASVDTSFDTRALGVHHMHSDGIFTVFDTVAKEDLS